jgi:hypothetical protein
MGKDRGEPRKEEDLVNTPGGPRPRESVHLTPPGSTIPFQGENPASIPPAQADQPIHKRGTNVAQQKVITPGGVRDRSRVRLAAPGSVVNVGGTQAPMIAAAMTKPKSNTPPGPPSQANWISAGWWYNDSGSPISSFVTTWTVPPMPETQAAQLLYLFNGMQPANTAPFLTILQPVLQWGSSGPDEDGVMRTGSFWTIASWIVPDATGSVHHTPHIRVEPGEVLVGVMALTGQAGGLFTYSCGFQGIAGTMFSVTNMPELVWCVETLEAYENNSTTPPPYDLDSAAEYPATDRTAFGTINIRTGAAPTSHWAPDNYETKYGEHTTVVSDSATNGEVDIYYS